MTSESIASPSILPGNSSREARRLYGIDLLRAACALLVVLLHAAIPYMNERLPGLIWAIMPTEGSQAANLIGWGIDGFIMPIFFLMNGYFAAQLLQQRGSKAFRTHRLRRIGGPFLFGCAVILPMDLYVWLTGWVISDIITIQKLKSLKIGGELGQALHGVCHLWFLQYVLVYCLAASWLWDWFVRYDETKQRSRHSISFGNAPVVFARTQRSWGPSLVSLLVLAGGILVAGSVLWWQPRIVIGFRHSWGPLWENLVYYVVPFTLGWCWERHSGAASSQVRWLFQLALSAIIFSWLWPELQAHVRSETIPVTNWKVPFLFASFGILVSTGLFGFFLHAPITRIPASIQYLSKASFWIYLFHHPAVALAQVNLLHVPISATMKFWLSFSIAVGFCLLTYEGLVRRTWVGELLNGTRDGARRTPLRVTGDKQLEHKAA